MACNLRSRWRWAARIYEAILSKPLQMNTEQHALLLSCDVKGAWEHPPDAHWQGSITELEALHPSLEASLGTRLELDKQVQDASFFADLGVLVRQPSSSGTKVFAYAICFRFSWFAKLYTIHGSAIEQYIIVEAQRLLAEHGYQYVPEAALQGLYDGLNEPLEPGLTWWTRYFDYL